MLKTIRTGLAAAAAAAVLLSACGRRGADEVNASSGQENSSSAAVSQTASIAASQTSSASQPVSSAASAGTPSSSAPVTTKFADPESDPDYVEAYKYYSANQYDKAISVCEAAAARNTDCFWAYNIKGISLYFANGNSVAEKSLALIDKALSINPNYAYAWFNEALINKGLKQYDKSIECFNKDLALKPDDQWAYFGIATVYADTDNPDKCFETLKKSIEIDASVKETARTESHFQKYKDNARFKELVQ